MHDYCVFGFGLLRLFHDLTIIIKCIDNVALFLIYIYVCVCVYVQFMGARDPFNTSMSNGTLSFKDKIRNILVTWAHLFQYKIFVEDPEILIFY